MKIALINPPFQAGSGYRGSMHDDPPLGLAYIAAYLRQAGHIVTILDPEPCRMPLKFMWNKLSEFGPDVVGIASFTPNFMVAKRLAKEAKELFGCFVVMGGPHVTAIPRSTLLGSPSVDAIILGEGEIPMLALAKEFDSRGDINFNTIPGVAFIENGQYREITRPEPISDLDKLPYPEQPFKDSSGSRDIVSLISSRGCPGYCNFCANVCMGHKFRAHSPEYIVNEISYLADKYGVKSFRFVDDCFTADTKRVVEICDRIIDKRLNITWWASGRVNTVQNEAMVLKMKRAGCIAMQLGIETGSQYINDLMRKGTTLEMAETCCSLLRKYEIAILSAFIIGNEGDTAETVEETIAFAKKLKSTTTTFHMLIPYPGTPLFKKYYNDYDRPDTNWDFWCSEGLNRPYEPRQTSLSKKDIVRFRNRAYWRLYSNPFQLLRTLAFGMR